MIDLKKLKSDYLKNGFVVIPLLSESEVKALRHKILQQFKPGESGELYMDFYLKELQDLDFYLNEQLLKSLGAIFSSVHYITDLNIQVNRIDQYGPKKGWHVDCNYEERHNQAYLAQTDYECAKVGIYLQDDTLDYGGGIDVQPGFHRLFFNANGSWLKALHKKIRHSVSHIYPYKRLAVRAGQAVIFDSRLMHRSSSSRISLDQKDASKSKVVIYWNVTGSQSMAETYSSTLIERAFSPGMPNYLRVFWENMLSTRFPEDFSKEFVDKAHKNNVNFWSHSTELCEFFKNRTSSYGSRTGFLSSNFTSYPVSKRKFASLDSEKD